MTIISPLSSVRENEFSGLYDKVLGLYPDIIDMQHTLDSTNKRISFDIIVPRELNEEQKAEIRQSVLEALLGRGYKCSIHDIYIMTNQEPHAAVSVTQNGMITRLRFLLGI